MNRDDVLTLAIHTALAVAIMGALFHFQLLPHGFTETDLESQHAFQDYCQTHNGELVMVNSIWHGGHHCYLPNGTTVRYNEWVEAHR